MAILIEGNCPNCGESSLYLNGKRVACNRPECSRPTAAYEILSEPQGTDHVVVIEHNGFSVKHPIVERLDGALLHCGLADHVAEFGQDWLVDSTRETGSLQPGVAYRMWAETGYTPDTPNGPAEYDYQVCWPIDVDNNDRAIPFEEESRG